MDCRPGRRGAFWAKPIKDDQLRMMFSCCHPRLPEEAQVALVLHILCGFSVNEIANAFVSSDAAIEKRISRAKKVLAGSKRLFDVSGADNFSGRLPAVQRALYLLFNEGYHGASSESAVRAELCQEAMRFTALLLEHPPAVTPATHALAALMCLHAARLPARVDASGSLISLFDQDRSRWDSRLVAEGQRFLDLSATGPELTQYHVEAAIAWVHTMAHRTEDTDWGKIVSPLQHVDGDTSFPGRWVEPRHRHRAARRPQTRARRDSHHRRRRSPRHLPFLPRCARRVRISQREI